MPWHLDSLCLKGPELAVKNGDRTLRLTQGSFLVNAGKRRHAGIERLAAKPAVYALDHQDAGRTHMPSIIALKVWLGRMASSTSPSSG